MYTSVPVDVADSIKAQSEIANYKSKKIIIARCLYHTFFCSKWNDLSSST